LLVGVELGRQTTDNIRFEGFFPITGNANGVQTIFAPVAQPNIRPALLWRQIASSGNNYGSYENPVFDAYVDSALASFDPATRKAYFTKAYETIIQDAPAIWLAEPRPTVGYHSRLRLGTLRPDAWWAHISEWWIPADKRIPRDNAPPSLSTPPAQSAGQKTP
jgi:ABC-type transport system substrate-binding protein